MTYQSVNPHDGKTLKSFEKLTGKPEPAIGTAATCLETRPHTTYAECEDGSFNG